MEGVKIKKVFGNETICNEDTFVPEKNAFSAKIVTIST